MNASTTNNQVVDEALEAVASVLIRAFLVGMGVMIFWFASYLFAFDLTRDVHSKLFGISEAQFTIMNYYGISLFKMLLFGFFLLPYIGIRWTLARRKHA